MTEAPAVKDEDEATKNPAAVVVDQDRVKVKVADVDIIVLPVVHVLHPNQEIIRNLLHLVPRSN